jgi:hypothetical protein
VIKFFKIKWQDNFFRVRDDIEFDIVKVDVSGGVVLDVLNTDDEFVDIWEESWGFGWNRDNGESHFEYLNRMSEQIEEIAEEEVKVWMIQ